MKRDGRLSGVLHLLIHMAEGEGPFTSETLAQFAQTNPVVVRRMLAGLRAEGIVRSEKGHGGGWTLAKDLDTVTLGDIYRAIGEPSLFAIGNRNENPNCIVEQAVNAALGDVLQQAEDILLTSFDDLTLSILQADFRKRFNNLSKRPSKRNSHG